MPPRIRLFYLVSLLCCYLFLPSRSTANCRGALISGGRLRPWPYRFL